MQGVRDALPAHPAHHLRRVLRPRRGGLRLRRRCAGSSRASRSRPARARCGATATCCRSRASRAPACAPAARRWCARAARPPSSASASSGSRTTAPTTRRSRYKDRVVSVAITQGDRVRLHTVGCASTGNLAHSVSAHAAAAGLEAVIFIPHDLERARSSATQVFGAAHDQDPRQLRRRQPPLHRDRRRVRLGARQRQPAARTTPRAPRPTASRSPSSSAGGCRSTPSSRSPAARSCPRSGRRTASSSTSAWSRTTTRRSTPRRPRAATRCRARSSGRGHLRAAEAAHDRQEHRDRQPGRRPLRAPTWCASRAATRPRRPTTRSSAAIELLARTEGIFTEPAGGTTLACAIRLIESGRIPRDESIVVSITGNGLKTIEAVSRDGRRSAGDRGEARGLRRGLRGATRRCRGGLALGDDGGWQTG